MYSWKDLERQVEGEQRTARKRERAALRQARQAELERMQHSAVPDLDMVILEFLSAAAEVRFPQKGYRGQIRRDPPIWQWWLPEERCTYTVTIRSTTNYHIEKDGTWECEHDFGGNEWGNWRKLYGKRLDGYFLMEDSPIPGERDVSDLQRALLVTMKELQIPLPE